MTDKPNIGDVRALEAHIVSTGTPTDLLTFRGILRSHEEMHAALSTPPADDVREALYNMLRWGTENDDDEMGAVDRILRVFEVRPHGTLTDAEAKELTTVHAVAQATSMSVESVIGWLAAIREAAREDRPHGTVAPPADDVRETLVDVVREAIAEAYVFEGDLDPDVDAAINAAIGAALIDNSRFDRPRGKVTDTKVEAGAQAMFEDPLYDAKYTWAEMVTEDPSRADIWRADARRVLEAAREVHP